MRQTIDNDASGARGGISKRILHDALLAAAMVVAVSLAEILYWQSKGVAENLEPLLVATLVLAGLCALLSAAASCAGRFRRVARVLALAGGLWPFAQHAAGFVVWRLFKEEPWNVVGVVLALLAGEGSLRMASGRAVRTTLLASVPVLFGLVLWQHHALVAPGPKAHPGSHPDVIVLVMDTTRRDRFGLYGYGPPTTPNIDALAKTSEVFDSAWSTAPWTPPSHASLYTGQLPAEHGVDGQAYPPFHTQAKGLAEVFQEQGYRTGAAVANAMLTDAFGGWERGFDDFLTFWNRSEHSLAHWLNRLRTRDDERWDFEERRAPSTLRLAKKWWEGASDAPRFLFVNLIDPHYPYKPPDDFYRRFLPGVDPARAYAVEQDPGPYHVKPGISAEDRAILSGLYDAEIAYMDQQIGLFLDWLRERGDLDRTLLVLTSDHGERLGERGLTGHEVMMDPFLLRIPLIVHYPARLEPQRVDSLVQIDGIPGYVLDLAGLDAPESMRARAIGHMQHDWVAAQNQEPLGFLAQLVKLDPSFDMRPYLGDWNFVSDGKYGWIDSTHKLASPRGLFDLTTDPELTRDLSTVMPELKKRFETIEATLPRFRPVNRHGLSHELMKRLLSIGYAGDR